MSYKNILAARLYQSPPAPTHTLLTTNKAVAERLSIERVRGTMREATPKMAALAAQQEEKK